MLGKVTTRSFLDTCDPRVQELFKYWEDRRGDRAMPRRRDIDPVDFPYHLASVVLVDVHADGTFVYRVVGTNEVAIRGYDPTGRSVAEAYFGPSLEDVLACYGYVREHGSFLFDPNPFVSKNQRYRCDETLFLPLSEDGETVSQILVYAVSTRLR